MTDTTLATKGRVAVFTYTQDDFSDLPKYLGTIQAATVKGLTSPKGTLKPVLAKDPAKADNFIVVEMLRDAPDLGEASLDERLHMAAINYLESIMETGCAQVWLIKLDPCGRPDDIDSWSSILIVTNLMIESLDYGELEAFDANQELPITGSLKHIPPVRKILPLLAAKTADVTVLAEILDILYADSVSCGGCAPYSSGCSKIYGITRANTGSPGLSGQLVYSTDGASTWASDDITSLGGLDPSKMAAVGNYLVVVSEADGAHHYALKSVLAWTRVSTGYVVGGAPRCIFAKSPTEVFMGGAGGYLYKSANITASVTPVHSASATTQNTNGIGAAGQTVVSVHNSNTVLVSINNGSTFSILTTNAALNGPEAGADLLCVWVVDKNNWFIGTDTGKLWHTSDGGKTFVQVALPDQSNVTAVMDIKFSPDNAQVGAVAVQKTLNGYVYRTLSGGRTWLSGTPGLSDVPAAEKYNAVSLCGVNNIVMGGKASASTDGIIGLAEG